MRITRDNVKLKGEFTNYNINETSNVCTSSITEGDIFLRQYRRRYNCLCKLHLIVVLMFHEYIVTNYFMFSKIHS